MTTRENVVASRLSKLMLSSTSGSGSGNGSGSGSSNNQVPPSPTSPGEQSQSQSELNQLKRDADPQFSRFADYFVICGLDLDTGLEPDRFAGEWRTLAEIPPRDLCGILVPPRGQPALLAAGPRLQEQAFGPLSRECALEPLRCPRHLHGKFGVHLSSCPVIFVRVGRLIVSED